MVPRETPAPPADFAERLQAYAGLVRRFAARLDLVSPNSLASFEERHIADSLKAVPILDALTPGAAIDVGSGAGLPGIPLALARPEWSWTLLEPRSGRAGFLEEAVRTLGIDAEVVRARAEDVADRFEGFGLGAARALAPPSVSVALIAPLVAQGGVVMLWVGENTARPVGSSEPVPGVVTMSPSL